MLKKHNKTLYQQSLLLSHTDSIGDDEDHIYTRIPKNSTLFTPDTTITTEQFSTLTKTTDTPSTNAIKTQRPINFATPCSQMTPFYDPSFFK